MSGDPNALFDKALDQVRKDRSKLEHVLKRSGDMRRDMEPGLKTALRVDSVDQPEMPPVARQAYRSQAQSAGVNRAKQVKVAKPLPPWIPDPRAQLGGFLLTPSLQNLVNLLIIFVVVFVIILGGVFMIPNKRPVGKLLGQMISMMPTRGDLIGGLLSTADAKNIGEAINGAINDNPEFLVDMISVMPTETLAYVVTEVMTKYPEALTGMMDGLDPKALAAAINTPNTTKLITDLMTSIDPGIISAVMNAGTVDMMSEMLKYLDPEPVAYIVNNIGPFATELVGSLSPVVLADVINENGQFISDLMGVMDLKAAAPLMNELLGSPATASFASDLLGRLDANMLAGIINNNPDFLKKAAGSMDLSAMAPAINRNGPWIAKLLGKMNPAVLADIVNSNIPMVNKMVSSMDMTPMAGLINDVMRDYGFINKMLGAINPAVINQVIGNSGAFMSSMLATLDPQVINQMLAMVAGQGAFVANLIGYISPEFVGSIVNNQAFISKVLSVMNPAVIAGMLNDNADKINGLLAAMNPQVLATAIQNALPQMVPNMLANMDPQALADIVNGIVPDMAGMMPDMMDMLKEMMDKLDPTVISDIFNEAGPFISGLLGKLDPKALALVINSNGPFITKTLAVLDPAFMANIINDNPEFLKKAMNEIDPQAVANLVNSLGPDMGPVVGEMLAYLSPTAVASIINNNPDFVSDMIGAMDPSFMSAAMDKSSAFINGLLPFIDEQVVAAIINNPDVSGVGGVLEGAITQIDPSRIANAINANPDMLASMMGMMDAQALGNMMNDLLSQPITGNVVERLLAVLAGAPQSTLQVLADAVNNNASMISSMISDLDASLIPILADVINRPEVMGPGGLAIGLISNLDASVLGGMLMANPAAMGQMLASVDVSLITGILNDNPTLLSDILAMMDPTCLTQMMPMGAGAFDLQMSVEMKGKAQVFGMWFTLPITIGIDMRDVGIVLAPP